MTTAAEEKRSSTIATVATTTTTTATAATTASSSPAEEDTDPLLDNSNFLSFDDWKKQNLAKIGQSAEHVGGDGNRRTVNTNNNNNNNNNKPTGINNALESFGDESEIDLDFGGFAEPASSSSKEMPWSKHGVEEAKASGDGGTMEWSGTSRGRDAGTTCKERFNYASFDCAATVLKTNPQCQGSSSVLVENKDSYMLNECRAPNKFIILELCDDILVDTVVLANYEFFSSIFHTFRVSVSDRYPAKQWKELGVYEARNTRELQAFPVENPLIWARYLRIEFLTHYGTEFYCPLSLVRVHGTTMMEEYKHDWESGRLDEGIVMDEPVVQEQGREQDQVLPKQEDKEKHPEEEEERLGIGACPNIQVEVIRVLLKGHGNGDIVDCCPASENATVSFGNAHDQHQPSVEQTSPSLVNASISVEPSSPPSSSSASSSPPPYPHPPPSSSIAESAIFTEQNNVTETTHHVVSSSVEPSESAGGMGNNAPAEADSAKTTSKPTMKEEQQSTSTSLTATTESISATSTTTLPTTTSPSTSSSPTSRPTVSQPTTQESFFKSVNKRLQMLESNSTLSLLYIEEQSRILREAFNKVEKRQLAKTSAFLESLNTTVRSELKQFRDQYEDLWKVVTYEHAREIYALSGQLGVITDELVFQKRLFVIQSIMVLICFGLVLFSSSFSSSFTRGKNMSYLMSPVFGSRSPSPSSARGGRRIYPVAGSDQKLPLDNPQGEDDEEVTRMKSPDSSSYNTPRSSSDDSSEQDKADESLPSTQRSESSPPALFRAANDDDDDYNDDVSERDDFQLSKNN